MGGLAKLPLKPAKPRSATGPLTVKPAGQSATSGPKPRRVVKNGYNYVIDAEGRTRQASGALHESPGGVRSRREQLVAGGTDRRPTDQGGHYIAPRFDGPTDAFNHFAQDANFNTGAYRVLEDKWAKEGAKRQGRQGHDQTVVHRRVDTAVGPLGNLFRRPPDIRTSVSQ
ncbi:MAG: DNA/RNA non-specific endonuclease [Janthinobacterium lividum]